MKNPANNKQCQEHVQENGEHPKKKEGALKSANQEQEPDLVKTPGYEEPDWAPSSLVEQERGGLEAPTPSEASAKDAVHTERPYDPSEDYYASSATQSFLHDSYYPHLYYWDWHETGYDETDRLQDYYRDAAYDAQSYYHQEAYRDYDYGDHLSQYSGTTFLHSGHAHMPKDTFDLSAMAMAGALAVGEANAHQEAIIPDEPLYTAAIKNDWDSFASAEDPHVHSSVALPDGPLYDAMAQSIHGDLSLTENPVALYATYPNEHYFTNADDESSALLAPIAPSSFVPAESKIPLNADYVAFSGVVSPESSVPSASANEAQPFGIECVREQRVELDSAVLNTSGILGDSGILHESSSASALTGEAMISAAAFSSALAAEELHAHSDAVISHKAPHADTAKSDWESPFQSEAARDHLGVLLPDGPPYDAMSQNPHNDFFLIEGPVALHVASPEERYLVNAGDNSFSVSNPTASASFKLKEGEESPTNNHDALSNVVFPGSSAVLDLTSDPQLFNTGCVRNDYVGLESAILSAPDIASDTMIGAAAFANALASEEPYTHQMAAASDKASHAAAIKNDRKGSFQSEEMHERLDVLLPDNPPCDTVLKSIHESFPPVEETIALHIASPEERFLVNVNDSSSTISIPAASTPLNLKGSKKPSTSDHDAPSDVLLPESCVASVLAGNSKSSGKNRAEEHLVELGPTALDALNIAGGMTANVAASAALAAGETALSAISTAAREDELTGRAIEGQEIVFDAVSKEISKNRSKRSSDFKDLVANAESLLVTENPSSLQMDAHEKSAPVGAEELAERAQEEKLLLKKKSDFLEEDVKEFSLEGSGVKDGKKPVTKRERELLAKKEQFKKSGLDSGESHFLINPANKMKDSLSSGARVAKNVATSSVAKVIANENEDVATLATMSSAGKKGVNATRNIARIPVRIAHGAQQVAHFARAVWQMITHAASAIIAAGWPVVLFLLGILIAVVVVVVGSLVIINENQETSELTALVAELDDQLEAEIHAYGESSSLASIPIYYCDARGTYNLFSEAGEDQTLDVDMKDDASDLQLVDASSVNVFTNPDGIIAYIDAKYSGEWQVGAASWKVTKEWNGKTYNIIDWENVPEWVQAGLNKIDRETFRGKIQELVRNYLMEEVLPEKDYGPRDLETHVVEDIAEDVADGLANVIYDQQLQDASDEVIYETVRASIQEHGDDLIHITDEHLQEMNYQLMEEFTNIVGEQEPVALVYDEVVELHGLLNYWSEDYEHIDVSQAAGGGTGGSGAAETNNAYGYPNASGYDPDELAKWDGYNEVSVYGISEAGTTSVTGDGTRITNNWNDTNMAIACEGLQNGYFAYWTSAYKKLHDDSSQPVRITMYNPETGATVTAEVRDCGGWRGFNERYLGMNAIRQWDLLPAVWLALGGSQSSGLMNVYWKVDNEAPITGGAGIAAAEVVIGSYPWEKETDNISGEITVNHATYIRHDIQDLLRNVPRIEKLIGRDNFASDEEFYAVIDFVVMKLKDIMLPVLTNENALGDTYTDYFMTRRELGSPFGSDSDGAPVQWIISERFSPGYKAFDKERVSVGIKPLSGNFAVYAVKEGTVIDASENSVTTSVILDGDVDERIVYEGLSGIQVSVGDTVKTGTRLGTQSDRSGSLLISWYEEFTYVGDLSRQRGWAYCPSLFMSGFAGYEDAAEPTGYVGGGARSLADCETIVDFAYSRLGCPYVWGATGPDTFDCSGLTQWCYAQAGITIPRNSEQQHDAAAAAGNLLPLNESVLQPGDILWKKGHVGIYIGNNQYIHAPQTGDVVKISTGISYFSAALRFY